MKRRILKMLFVLALSITLITGCSKKSKNDVIEAKKNIGTDGGTIKASSNLKLDIPKNALNDKKEITIKYVSDEKEINEEPSLNFLGSAIFGPSGTTFNTPIDVSIKLKNNTQSEELSVFCYNEEENLWDYVTTATVNGENANFKITHFSKYMVLDITPKMLSRFRELIVDAKNFGNTDSWIMDQYYDYLVNEEHILDYYQEFNGIYHEAIGLSIDGAYDYYGEENIPGELTRMYGEDGKIGNRLANATVGQLLERTQESVTVTDAKGRFVSNHEDQFVYYVTVCVTYKMIKPQIDLTSEKTNLKKGEKVNVDVFCHYINPNNYFYKDFILPNYDLTLPFELKNFTVDKTELCTDGSGHASFSVTAKSQGSDTIKVMFYVEGVFGEYASQFITFSCGLSSYSFTGHITETESFIIEPESKPYADMISIKENGSFIVTVEYDIEGHFNLTKDKITGTMSFKNIKATFDSNSYDFIDLYSEDEPFEVIYNPFEKSDDIITYEQIDIPICGDYYKSSNNLMITYDYDNNPELYMGLKIVDIPCLEKTTEHGDTKTKKSTAYISVAGLQTFPIDSIKLEVGTQTISKEDFNDNSAFIAYNTEFGPRYYFYKLKSSSTTQTITIKEGK